MNVANDRRWDDLFHRLQVYKRKYGNCKVPRDYEEDPQLGMWVHAQRRMFRTGKLRRDRKDRLESLGMNWYPHNGGVFNEARWEKMFRKLQKYNGKHGNCRVPRSYKEDPQLGMWVERQRQNWRTGKLTMKRKGQLGALGFEWEPGHQSNTARARDQWEARYQELVQFHRLNGHSQIQASEPVLWAWTRTQRSRRFCPGSRKRFITEDEIARLAEIGFQWRLPRRGRKLTNEKGETVMRYEENHESHQRENSEKEESSPTPGRKRRQHKKGEEHSTTSATFGVRPDKRCKSCSQSQPSTSALPTVGQRVAVYWPMNDEYYPGTINGSRRNGRIHIRYDDGDEQWVQLSKLCYLLLTDPMVDQRADNPDISSLHVGSRVSVWWQTEERFYDGTVKKIKELSLLNPHRIVYDDGDKEWTHLAFRRFRFPGLEDANKVKAEP